VLRLFCQCHPATGTNLFDLFEDLSRCRPLRSLTEVRWRLGLTLKLPANMVYVDNVVDAIARRARSR